MAGYNGDGTFSFTYNWVNDAANGIPITASRMDGQFNDAVSGFDLVICRDGQSTISANIPWGGFKITGLGAATTAGDALSYGSSTNSSTLLVPTSQTLTVGTGATYTKPANCRQLRIRMLGGGGGGSSSNGAGMSVGTDGGDSSFDATTAIGGKAATGTSSGTTLQGGLGGSGGVTGIGTEIIRIAGNPGEPGAANNGITNGCGGNGGSSVLGGSGRGGFLSVGAAAAANSGSGGGGGQDNTLGTGGAPGGGAAEWVEFYIDAPAATYLYTIGAGGPGSALAQNGGDGADGIIIVEELY